MRDQTEALGAIMDTNSGGRFDLVVDEDGILAIKGTYLGVVLRVAGGALAGQRYEERRLSRSLERERSEVLAGDPKNHFVPIESITGLVLRKRWHEHSLTIVTIDQPTGRRYSWKPALNNFKRVRTMLQAKFGEALAIE